MPIQLTTAIRRMAVENIVVKIVFAILVDYGNLVSIVKVTAAKSVNLADDAFVHVTPPPCQMITKKQLVILDFSVSVKILMA